MSGLETICVAAFVTASGIGGNKAGVHLMEHAAELSEKEMQDNAARLKYSETAYVKQLSSDEFSIRFFTPTAEVPNCGHATVGSFGYLRSTCLIGDGLFKVNTAAGQGVVEVRGDFVYLHQAEGGFSEIEIDSEIMYSLGLSKEDLLPKGLMGVGSTGVPFLLIEVPYPSLAKIAPQFDLLRAISRKRKTVGYYVFAKETDDYSRLSARMFAPEIGIEEESATGMAAGALVTEIFKRNRGMLSSIVLRQGEHMNPPQPAVIEASYDGETSKVKIGGRWDLGRTPN